MSLANTTKNLKNKLGNKRARPVVFIIAFAVIGAIVLLATRAAGPFASVESEDANLSGVTAGADANASGGSYLQFGADTVNKQDSVYITLAEATTLPKSGNGYNNTKAIADQLKQGKLTPNLDDVNTRAGSVSLTAATFWLANGKSDTTLLAALKAYILAAPGTNKQATQALNPMRGIGGLLAAVDILNKAGVWDMNANCPNASMSFNQWITGLETRNLGDGNGRWKTIKFTSTDSANNWGAVARFALIMIAEVRNDTNLKNQSIDLFRRYLGDTTKANAFNKSGSYIASWDNTGSASGKVNAGIGFKDSNKLGLDGVVVDDVNRGGTQYSETAPFYGATGSGITYPLEAAEYVWATAAVVKHMGYSDVATWSNSALLRMGDWFDRAKDSTGKSAYQVAESSYSIYKHSRWYGNWWRGGTPYGQAPATSGGEGALLRSQPPGDYMAGPGSQWLR